VQFRQHFSDQLARELELNAGRLDGQDRDVTLMFADIRGFSRLSERLGPRDTFRFVSDVMGALTEAVHHHEGVVMDYVGDELIAVWNAPTDLPDHARMAADCAAALPRYLAPVDEQWRPRLAGPVRVGVGINTGPARVGNTGTRYKFKYGALGHTVNVASRIQGATKAFKLPVLMARSTRTRLPAATATRRLGLVRVVGIDEPVELHELAADPSAGWQALRTGYEAALERFEAGDVPGAAGVLKELLATPAGEGDGPARLLGARAAALLGPGTAPLALPFVIELSEK
jgi:adenylate cyclase